MAAEMQEVTDGNEQESVRNLLEHILTDVHEIAQAVHQFATPEARAMLDGFLSNPAVKWKARRNGRTSV